MLTDAPRRYGPILGTGVGVLSWICQGIVAAGYLRERVRPASPGNAAELRRIEEARAD
jgi:hypothetical protein